MSRMAVITHTSSSLAIPVWTLSFSVISKNLPNLGIPWQCWDRLCSCSNSRGIILVIWQDELYLLYHGFVFPMSRYLCNSPLFRNHDKFSVILFRFNITKSVLVFLASPNKNSLGQMATCGLSEVAIYKRDNLQQLGSGFWMFLLLPPTHLGSYYPPTWAGSKCTPSSHQRIHMNGIWEERGYLFPSLPYLLSLAPRLGFHRDFWLQLLWVWTRFSHLICLRNHQHKLPLLMTPVNEYLIVHLR